MNNSGWLRNIIYYCTEPYPKAPPPMNLLAKSIFIVKSSLKSSIDPSASTVAFDSIVLF